jgi:hypothetical protein
MKYYWIKFEFSFMNNKKREEEEDNVCWLI